MKRGSLLLATALCLFTCGVPAQAATLSNESQGITAPVETQAQMLKDLGLFRGTNKGFELDRAMTRDEAAAMLVRFLGAEENAQSASWQHPFTDVEPWANPYVGWLYQEGLTKGGSQTRYGAADKVTAEQFCIFLSRAASGTDDNLIAFVDERAACDKAGFTRGDAVVLSTRALSTEYMQVAGRMTMAQHLIDGGAFTAEQLRDAAWDVMPREYGDQITNADSNGAWRLSCVMAGVCVLRNEAVSGINAIYDSVGCAQLYGMRLENGQHVLYRIDRKTLAIEKIGAFSSSLLVPIGSIDGTDYLGILDFSVASPVYAIKGITVTELPYPLKDGNPRVAIYTLTTVSYPTDGGICVIDASGIRVQGTAGECLFATLDGCHITVEQSAEQTIVRNRKWPRGNDRHVQQ